MTGIMNEAAAMHGRTKPYKNKSLQQVGGAGDPIYHGTALYFELYSVQ